MEFILNRIHGGRPYSMAESSGTPHRGVVDFSASINPIGPPPLVKKIIKEVSLKTIYSYPDMNAERLKKALALYHGIPASTMLPGNGSTHLIYLIVKALRPESALIINPAFSEYRNALILSGAVVDSFTLSEEKDFSIDSKGLSQTLLKGYDMLFLANPSSPRGQLIPPDSIREIVALTEKKGTWLILDEAFMDFCEYASFKKEAIKKRSVIVLRSMTKFFSLAGLRIGCAIAHEEVINFLEQFMEPWAVNSIAQIAGIESLKDIAFVKETLAWLKEERDFLFNSLRSIDGLRVYPSSANFLLVRIKRDDLDSTTLQKRLFFRGILIRDCSSFIGLDRRFFRVTILRREDNERLIGCLKEVFFRG